MNQTDNKRKRQYSVGRLLLILLICLAGVLLCETAAELDLGNVFTW